MINVSLLIILGIFAGTLSGLIGIGGGVIVVPALLYIFGLSQLHAQGTTLAMLVMPIGFFAAHSYYKHGYVDIRIAFLICIGFFLGSYFGAKMAIGFPEKALTKVFGFFILIIALKMIFAKQ